MNIERGFDTLQYANRLKAAGVPDKQAEAHAELQAEIIENRLAAKLDLENVKSELKRDIKALDLKIENLRVELKRDIEVSKNELIIKLGSMMIGGLGALVILMKIFKL